MRRLSARHRWNTRAAAFDNHRANAASLALDQLLRDESSAWKQRVKNFRDQEWSLHEEMVRAARIVASHLLKHPARARFGDLPRLLDSASVLGRRACGLPLDGSDAPPPPPDFSDELEAAIRKVYPKEPPPAEPPPSPPKS